MSQNMTLTCRRSALVSIAGVSDGLADRTSAAVSAAPHAPQNASPEAHCLPQEVQTRGNAAPQALQKLLP